MAEKYDSPTLEKIKALVSKMEANPGLYDPKFVKNESFSAAPIDDVEQPVRGSVAVPPRQPAAAPQQDALPPYQTESNWAAALLPLAMGALVGGKEGLREGAGGAAKTLRQNEKGRTDLNSYIAKLREKRMDEYSKSQKDFLKPSDKNVMVQKDGKILWEDARNASGQEVGFRPSDRLSLEDMLKLQDAKNKGKQPLAEQKKNDKMFDQERKLYSERESNATTKRTRKLAETYERIANTTFSSPNPMDDISLVFDLFRLLDEDSVVRESEQSTGYKARSYTDLVANAKDLMTGERKLTDTQVKHIKNLAKRVYTQQMASQERYDSQLARQAKTYGLRPEQVINPISISEELKRLDAEQEAQQTPSAGAPKVGPTSQDLKKMSVQELRQMAKELGIE